MGEKRVNSGRGWEFDCVWPWEILKRGVGFGQGKWAEGVWFGLGFLKWILGYNIKGPVWLKSITRTIFVIFLKMEGWLWLLSKLDSRVTSAINELSKDKSWIFRFFEFLRTILAIFQSWGTNYANPSIFPSKVHLWQLMSFQGPKLTFLPKFSTKDQICQFLKLQGPKL